MKSGGQRYSTGLAVEGGRQGAIILCIFMRIFQIAASPEHIVISFSTVN